LSELQQNRYDRLLRRVGDLKGQGSKVNDALSELFPMFDVENVPAELYLLGGIRICLGRTDQGTPGPALFRASMIRNPGGSNTIITLTSVVFASLAGQEIVLGPTLTSYTTAGTRAIADTRQFGPQAPVGQLLTDDLLVVGADFFRYRINSSEAFTFAPPGAVAVLAPGTAFSVSTGTADTSLTVGYTWRERQAEPSELNL